MTTNEHVPSNAPAARLDRDYRRHLLLDSAPDLLLLDSPFLPPYRSDACIEYPLVQLLPQTMQCLETEAQRPHQKALMKLIGDVPMCPDPIPLLVARSCPPSQTDVVRSERIHAVVQLLSQIREHEHQVQLRKAYKTFGSDHRKAAKELYARELFTIAYMHYWSLFSCLSCDRCRRLPVSTRQDLTIDLLEKLAVTCLRAGWLADAENFATEALVHDAQSMRARIWLATAQLGLGKLPAARESLSALPRRGQFPTDAPAWLVERVTAQREILARLERETRGVFELAVLQRERPDRTPDTPHATALLRVEATPAGYRTLGGVARDSLLLVAAPLACAPCYTEVAPPAPAESPVPDALSDQDMELFSLALDADAIFEHAKVHQEKEQQQQEKKKPRTLHDEDPSLLSLAQLADTVYTQAKILPHVRVSVRAAAARCPKESERVIDIVGNDLRAAAIVVTQNYCLSIPHASPRGGSSCNGDRDSSGTVEERPAHAGHALYVPSFKLISAPAATANTYATYHGPYLFLRASSDLRAGTILTFSGFAGTVEPPRGSTPRASTIISSTTSTIKPSSRGLVS